MTNFINTIIGVFIGFFTIIVSAFLLLGLQSDLQTQRVVLNETTNLIDKIKDTGVLSDADKADYYLALSTTGTIFEVDIIREMKVVNPRDSVSGEIVTSYVNVPDTSVYNQGDLVTVNVRAVDYTGAQKLMRMLISVINDKLEISLVGLVNNG